MAVFKKEGYWWIDYYDEHNMRKRKKVGRSRKVAQDTLEEVKTQVRQKKMGIVQKATAKPISIQSFFFQECREYFDTNLSHRTAKRYKSVLDHFVHFLRQMPKAKLLSQLQPNHFEKYKAYRKNVPFPKGLSYFEKSPAELAKLLEEARENGGTVCSPHEMNSQNRRSMCGVIRPFTARPAAFMLSLAAGQVKPPAAALIRASVARTRNERTR